MKLANPITCFTNRLAAELSASIIIFYFLLYSLSIFCSVRWLDSLIGNDSARQAFVHGSNHSDCSIFRCPISFTTLANMLKLGKTFLS